MEAQRLGPKVLKARCLAPPLGPIVHDGYGDPDARNILPDFPHHRHVRDPFRSSFHQKYEL
jgi:hypothetical protein